MVGGCTVRPEMSSSVGSARLPWNQLVSTVGSRTTVQCRSSSETSSTFEKPRIASFPGVLSEMAQTACSVPVLYVKSVKWKIGGMVRSGGAEVNVRLQVALLNGNPPLDWKGAVAVAVTRPAGNSVATGTLRFVVGTAGITCPRV